MQNHPPSAPDPSNGAPRAPRQSTNNDASLLAHSLKRLSLHTAAHTPLPQSPGGNSPRRPSELHRVPSSPGIPSNSPRRSPSVASVNRSSSPALGRKSSSSSLRGDMPPTPRAPPSRRSSLNPHMASPNVPKSPLGPQAEEKLPLRACDVAEEYFRKELALHEGITGATTAGTLVLVHDQCYGHRYSRPKTSKAALSTIVERPERIIATVLGISTAYVRLGARHCEGNNPPHPHHNPPERIPFKIRKSSRIVDITSPVVTNVHGTKWMDELKYLANDAERKLAATGKELVREPNAPSQPRKREFHETDLYLCSESLNAFQGALGGVLDAVDAVFQGTNLGTGPSRAFVCIRPPGHHCSADYPSGFCWLNNVHVGIEHAIQQHGLTHAAIIDFDLHHGDGSQAIAWARNKKVQGMHKNTPNWKKTSIGYFSLHDINSFPCEYGDDEKVQAASLCIDNAHGQSMWNIHLQPWTTPEEFWKLYDEKYTVLLEKTRQYLRFHTERLRKANHGPIPKSAIFISAGFDASEWETPGMQRHGANVPTDFYDRFTRDIVRLAEEEGTGVDGRVISVLEGGYSDRALTSGVLSHISGLTDGQVYSDKIAQGGLAFDMQQRLNGLSLREDGYANEEPIIDDEPNLVSGNPNWWHEARLVELENLVNPPVIVPKKVRAVPPSHFSSPTQSFTAKVVDPTKIHRSISGRFSASPSRAPTPPPPDVDWATASHALSKLLIPSEARQTRSCKPEDLAVPTVKKEKAVAPPPPTTGRTDSSGRQLRGRKPVTSYADPESDEEEKAKAAARAASRANRRRTIADFGPKTDEEPSAATRSASRRMSIASSIGSVNGGADVVGGPSSRASSVAPPPARRSVTPAASTNGTGVSVKKARGTTTTGGTTAAAASRIPKGQTAAAPPPVPRVPSGYGVKRGSGAGEKENDVDQLTSGLKRITIRMPTREEHDAKEKAAAAAAASKTTTRKPAVPRASKTTKSGATSTTATTAKKATARTTKTSKPLAPAPVPAPAPPSAVSAVPPPSTTSQQEKSLPAIPIPTPSASPQPPQISQAASTTAPTLAQPQTLPIPASQTSTTNPISIQLPTSHPPPSSNPIPLLPSTNPTSTTTTPSSNPPPPAEPGRKSSAALIDPRLIDPEVISSSPDTLHDVSITPDQLPRPEDLGSGVIVAAPPADTIDGRVSAVSPPRPDTPPAPPPARMPDFATNGGGYRPVGAGASFEQAGGFALPSYYAAQGQGQGQGLGYAQDGLPLPWTTTGPTSLIPGPSPIPAQGPPIPLPFSTTSAATATSMNSSARRTSVDGVGVLRSGGAALASNPDANGNPAAAPAVYPTAGYPNPYTNSNLNVHANARRPTDLPVFSSSGVIPFSSNLRKSAGQQQQHVGSSAAPAKGSIVKGGEEPPKQEQAEIDIWEVPETPAR